MDHKEYHPRKVFFTSDTHLGHGNIIKYCHRPFLSQRDKDELAKVGAWHDGSWKGEDASRWRMTPEAVALMDKTLIDNINALVGPNDTLWHLGDFAFGSKYDPYSTCRAYRDRINCQNVNIIWGNHDDRRIRDLFNEAYDLKQIRVDGHSMVLCHYAMACWDKHHRLSLQLYGHSHSEAEPWLDRFMPERRAMDVGVDNAAKLIGSYRPFSFEEIMDRLGSRSGHSAGDHHINPNAPTEEQLAR